MKTSAWACEGCRCHRRRLWGRSGRSILACDLMEPKFAVNGWLFEHQYADEKIPVNCRRLEAQRVAGALREL